MPVMDNFSSDRKVTQSNLMSNANLNLQQYEEHNVKQQVRTQVEVRIKKKYDYHVTKGNIEERRP